MIRKLKLRRLFKYALLTSFLLIVNACGNTGMNEQQMLQNAKTYLDKGELMAASIELRNALQKNNKHAEARYLLGTISLKIGDLAGAEKEFRRAADAGWSQQAVQLQLARIFIRKKSFKELLDEIKPVDTWPADARANIAGLRALAEAGLNKNKKAKDTLDKGRTLNKNAVQVLKSTAILQLAGILEGNASDTLKMARSLYPDNPEILLIHATNDIKNQNLSQAIETYSRVIALDPAKFLTTNGRRARIGLAHLQFIYKNYDEANSTLAPLLKQNSKGPEVNYLAGQLAFAKGDFNRAEDHIRKLLTILPENAKAHQLMGKIKYALKDFDQAAHHFATYLKAAPGDNITRTLLANTYIFLSQPEQARITLQSILNTNPNDATALALLSQIELNIGNMNAGITALRQAIKTNPRYALLHKQLAKAYILTGQTELALSEIAAYQKLSKDTEGAQKLTMSTYLQAGQNDKAMNIANQILIKAPEDPDTLALIGGLYTNIDNNQQAQSYFDKALKIQPGHPAATLGLARIEKENGSIDKAISLYKNLVDTDKAGTAPMLELSEIAAQQKRNNDMLSWLEKARSAAPTEIQARLILTRYYLRNAQPEKAEIYIKEAIKQSPEQPGIIVLHTKVLIAQKRYNEALPPLKKLAAKLPVSTAIQSLLGETYLRQNKLADARKHLQKALALQKSNIIAISLLSETELKYGNISRSIEYAKTLQKKQPELFIGHLLEGDAWMAKRNYSRAQYAYNKAWELQQTAHLAKRIFQASKNTSSPNKALQPLLTWLKDNPDDYSTRFYLATLYQDIKKNDKAIKQYEKLLKQTPDDSTILNNLAWLYSLNGNPKAMDMAESAYRFAPENPGILDTYGWILVQQGQIEKGRRLIKQAMEIIPKNPEIRYHYAFSLLKSGNTTDGKQILEELIRQDKSFDGREEAKRLLRDL